jgi:hypothetical protein
VKNPFLAMIIWLVLLPGICLAGSEPYFYPFTNPYEATVLGTPDFLQAELPELIYPQKRELKVFKDRDIPDVFWYQKKLVYSLVRQKGKAPLIFMIAGTGAGYNSQKMQDMQKAFYQAGFHVVSLPSPTHMNFIVTASESMVPGHLQDDARDLYRVMALIWQDIRGRVPVSKFYLTGYSLGAAQAAFVARLDEERRIFNFTKVLMINPPVSLYNSVDILDGLIHADIKDADKFNEWFDAVMNRMADMQKEFGRINFSGDFLYQAYKKHPPREDFLKTLIGLAFRLSSNNMIFTTDVMTNGGYIVPKNSPLKNSTRLTEFFKVGARTSFTDYFQEYFLPYHQSLDPAVTEESLIEEETLMSIEPYLKSASKIGLVTNMDDIILTQGELEYLRGVFQERAKIYPNGGHCGNMGHKDFVAHMVGFFRN